MHVAVLSLLLVRGVTRAVAALASIGLAAALIGVGSGVAPAAGICGEGPAIPVIHVPAH